MKSKKEKIEKKNVKGTKINIKDEPKKSITRKKEGKREENKRKI